MNEALWVAGGRVLCLCIKIISACHAGLGVTGGCARNGCSVQLVRVCLSVHSLLNSLGLCGWEVLE